MNDEMAGKATQSHINATARPATGHRRRERQAEQGGFIGFREGSACPGMRFQAKCSSMAKVLLVDDDLTMLQMVAELLRQEGHEVFPFSNGSAAVTGLTAHAPELVITDLYFDKARAHGLEVVLRAAEEMKEDRKTVFLLVGEGARKEELKERGRSLPNVRVLDSCPHAQVPEYIAASDLCLVHLRQSELFRTVLPSKMFEIMGCARPVLLGVDGEARATLQKADAGVAFPPEDGHALAEAVRRLKDDPASLARLGDNGRRFVEREYSRAVLAGRYSELLRDVIHLRNCCG